MSGVATPLPFFFNLNLLFIYLFAYFNRKLRNITHEPIMLRSHENNLRPDSSVCCCFITLGSLRIGTKMDWFHWRLRKEGRLTICQC